MGFQMKNISPFGSPIISPMVSPKYMNDNLKKNPLFHLHLKKIENGFLEVMEKARELNK